MAWYDTGTVAVTNGSTTVTGTGTDFISGAQVGEAFLAPDDKLYEIQSITSATVLVLADPYLGSTQSGQDYKIVPTQSLVADLASQVTDLITDYSDVKDTAGAGKFNDGTVTAPAITFEQDQNNGLYRIGNDNYAMSAGGVKQIDVSSTDVELNYGGNKKLATTSTGVDITGTISADALDIAGTITADGLTVDGDAPTITLHSTDTAQTAGETLGRLDFESSDASSNADGVRASIQATTENTIGATSLDFFTKDSADASLLKHMTIDRYGDISFYEDTGTTAKFVWDSSAESLGIGTANPSAKLEVAGVKNTSELMLSSTTNDASWVNGDYFGKLSFYSSDSSGTGAGVKGSIITAATGSSGATPYMTFNVASATESETERMRIDASGNVGIGTASPSSALSVATNGGAWTTSSSDGVGINYNSGNANISTYLDNSTLQIGAGVTQKNGMKIYGQTGGNRIEFQVAGSEKARIDSSGNLLVNRSSQFSNAKVEIQSDSGEPQCLTLNSINTDGNMLEFYKAGIAVGSIGSRSGVAFYVEGTGHANKAGLDFYSDVLPRNVGALSDATLSLGNSANRFKDLYLSGSVRQPQVMPNGNNGNTGTSGSTNYWKLGSIYLVDSLSAEIRILGTSSYSAGQPCSGATTIRLRGGNGTSTIEGYYYGETEGNQTIADVRWVNVSANNYDIYIKYNGNYAATNHWVDTDGAWTPALTDTGSESAPSGSTALNTMFGITTGGAERMRVDSSGNLLIGTTTTGLRNSGAMSFSVGTGSYSGVLSISHSTNNANGSGFINFSRDNAYIGSIGQSGTTGVSYNTTSDERLKENIKDTTHVVNIDDIKVREYDWKVDGSHQRFGFIAQELETVYPEAVTSPEDEAEMKSVDYSKLVPLLVKEIQTLKARIETLENN